MAIIAPDAKEELLERVREYSFPGDELKRRREMRREFTTTFTHEIIQNLTPDDYFPGRGKKEGHLGYQLEWGTTALGSIKGGSMAKYGDAEQFDEIKRLLLDLTSLSDEIDVFYNKDGSLTQVSRNLIMKSRNIKGMKSGRTVLGKLLSIYYPTTFMPFFGDQDYLLEHMLIDYSIEASGLEAYLKNNHLFLEIREELKTEPPFAEVLEEGELTNDFLYRFFCFCYPRNQDVVDEEAGPLHEEEKFEALETEHYQKLIHRNFDRLFPKLRYYDEDVQNSHEGHYATEDAGVMDFLCLNDQDDIIVIELKRKGTDKTLAQVCRYMGWAMENLANKNQDVYGVIISESKDHKLDYAVRTVPKVSIRKMKLDVSITDF